MKPLQGPALHSRADNIATLLIRVAQLLGVRLIYTGIVL